MSMADVTVYDVAKKAKVSIATVSRVLNSSTNVNEATRKRVLSAIDSLALCAEGGSRCPRPKSQWTHWCPGPLFTYPSFVERLKGVASSLADSPYELVVYNVRFFGPPRHVPVQSGGNPQAG